MLFYKLLLSSFFALGSDNTHLHKENNLFNNYPKLAFSITSEKSQSKKQCDKLDFKEEILRSICSNPYSSNLTVLNTDPTIRLDIYDNGFSPIICKDNRSSRECLRAVELVKKKNNRQNHQKIDELHDGIDKKVDEILNKIDDIGNGVFSSENEV